MRFEPDFAGVQAYTPIYPRGDYELRFERVEGIAYTKEGGDDDGKEVGGVRVIPVMVGKYDAKGKLQRQNLEGEDVSPIRMYVHSEGAWRMTKRTLMAAMGYDKKEEDKFNLEVLATNDWSVATEDGDDDEDERIVIGNGYEMLVGKHVAVTLDKSTRNDEEQQEFRNWRPVKK